MWNRTRTAACFWVFSLMLFQNALHFIFPAEIFPFLLIAVIFYAMSEGPGFGFAIGCFAGLFLDILAVGKIGPQTLAFGVAGLAAGGAASTLFRDSLWTQFLFPAVVSGAWILFSRLYYQSIYSVPSESAVWPSGAEWRSLVMTLMLAPFLFRFLKHASFERRERGLRWR